MTVCRFYLQGRCRYGDRCWNEHVDPSPEPQRRDNYTWVSPAVSQYRNYPQNQFSGGNFSNQSRNYAQNQFSGGNFSGQSRDYHQNQFSSRHREPAPRSNYSNDYSWNNRNPRNQYSDQPGWNNTSSSYYDNRSTESYERSKSPKQNTYFQAKPSNRFEVLAQENDAGKTNKDNSLISTVKNDITEWEESHIWPFSCHSHFKDYGSCLSGFVDLSPEELRCRAYEAEASGSFVLYTGIVADAMNEVKKKWEVLKNPTADVLQSIKSYQGTPDFCAENLKKLIGDIATGSFGGQVNSEMFVQNSNASASSGSFSFKLAHQDPPQSLGSSASAFKSVLPTTNKVESSFSAFGIPSSSSSGFGSSSTSVLTPSSTSSLPSVFGSSKEKQLGSTKAAISSELKSCAYTPLEKLTETEQSQFSSQTFTLGKIPSRPPPMELCF